MKNKVAKLYDKLFKFEYFFHKKPFYVHKKLNYNSKNINNQYDFLIATKLPENLINILDVGCGNGFGTLLLHQKFKTECTGISLSKEEINQANNFITSNNLSGIQFIVSDFNQIESEKYDAIIAIESLKHSSDIQETILHLTAKLAINGTLYIIDDFYNADNHKLSDKLQLDWHLKQLYSINDFTLPIINNEKYSIKTEDLTSLMYSKNSAGLNLKLFILNILCFIFGKQNSIFSIFRGGIILDILYDNKEMEYQLLSITKK